jgi:mannose-6-phosphate isomerase-like protein (cupin superfamily)
LEELEIGPGTRLRVIAESEDVLELEARYAGGGSPPPAHLHPGQDEHFEVLSGEMQARVGGQSRTLSTGEELDVPRNTVHLMWNESDAETVLNWKTMPAGRTLSWFRELAALQRGEGREDPATLLTDYSDVFQLAAE